MRLTRTGCPLVEGAVGEFAEERAAVVVALVEHEVDRIGDGRPSAARRDQYELHAVELGLLVRASGGEVLFKEDNVCAEMMTIVKKEELVIVGMVVNVVNVVVVVVVMVVVMLAVMVVDVAQDRVGVILTHVIVFLVARAPDVEAVVLEVVDNKAKSFCKQKNTNDSRTGQEWRRYHKQVTR